MNENKNKKNDLFLTNICIASCTLYNAYRKKEKKKPHQNDTI